MTDVIDVDSSVFHSFVESFTSALEARDQYTAGHSDRVAVLSEMIAYEMGFKRQKCEGIHIAGHLHDIGKIGIPDGILLKTGALRKCEFEVIKEHSVIGWRILKDIPGLEGIAEIVLQHHERIDGSGYPNGLTGNDISLGARIIAVADTYDAMTTFRSYKKPVSEEEAVEMIKEKSGSFFTRDIIEAFVNIVRDYEKIKSVKYEDFCSSHI